MERREFLGQLAAGPVVASLPIAAAGGASPGALRALPLQDRRIPFNRARADQVMAEEGIDGLIAANPVNVFYCTNLTSYRIRMAVQPAPSFAVVARDARRPIGLVAVTNDLWDVASADRDYPELIVPYTAPANWREIAEHGDFAVEPTAAHPTQWSSSPSTFTARERAYAAIDRQYADRLAPGPEWGLARVVKELGLTRARLAVDEPRIARILEWTGLREVRCIEGDNVFRRIRVVKSDAEIAHMRAVARVNQAAAQATLARLAAGATRADVEQIFLAEAAQRGATAVWIAAGTTAGMPDTELRAGQSLLIDAVSEVNHYHGDFARTFVLGEPSAALAARVQKMKIGWDAVFEALRPGLRYSEISQIGREAMRKSGLSDIVVLVGPHSVGLQHTDEPYVPGLPFAVKDDLVLEENMTITVDFPSQAPGLGHAHLEDLVRITRNGAEALGERDGVLVVGKI